MKQISSWYKEFGDPKVAQVPCTTSAITNANDQSQPNINVLDVVQIDERLIYPPLLMTPAKKGKDSGAIIPRPEILNERRKPRPTTVGPKDTPIDVVLEKTYDAKAGIGMPEL